MYDFYPYDVIEIESTEALRRRIEQGQSLQNVVVQGVDLTSTPVERLLTSVSAENAFFLGCELSEAAEQHVRETGGTLFPEFVGVPFQPYRASLYTPMSS